MQIEIKCVNNDGLNLQFIQGNYSTLNLLEVNGIKYMIKPYHERRGRPKEISDDIIDFILKNPNKSAYETSNEIKSKFSRCVSQSSITKIRRDNGINKGKGHRYYKKPTKTDMDNIDTNEIIDKTLDILSSNTMTFHELAEYIFGRYCSQDSEEYGILCRIMGELTMDGTLVIKRTGNVHLYSADLSAMQMGKLHSHLFD